jgi:hypothetical protein
VAHVARFLSLRHIKKDFAAVLQHPLLGQVRAAPTATNGLWRRTAESPRHIISKLQLQGGCKLHGVMAPQVAQHGEERPSTLRRPGDLLHDNQVQLVLHAVLADACPAASARLAEKVVEPPGPGGHVAAGVCRHDQNSRSCRCRPSNRNVGDLPAQARNDRQLDPDLSHAPMPGFPHSSEQAQQNDARQHKGGRGEGARAPHQGARAPRHSPSPHPRHHHGHTVATLHLPSNTYLKQPPAGGGQAERESSIASSIRPSPDAEPSRRQCDWLIRSGLPSAGCATWP